MKYRFKLCVFTVLMIFLLTGCGTEPETEESPIMLLEAIPLAITQERRIETDRIQMSSQYAYFVQCTDESEYSFFTHSITSPKEKPRKLFTLNCNHLVDFTQMPLETQEGLCVLFIRDYLWYINVIDSDGQLVKEIQIQKPESISMISLYGITYQSSENRILAYNKEAYYEVEDSGTLVRYPFENSVDFVNDISTDAEGNIYISYNDLNQASHIGIISKMNGSMSTIIDTNELFSFYRHGDVLYTKDARKLYRLATDGMHEEFQLSDIRKSGRNLRDFVKVDEEWYAVYCSSNSYLPEFALIHFFTAPEGYDIQSSTLSPISPPQIITIYSTQSMMFGLEQTVEAYNEEGRDYFAEIQIGTSDTMPRDLKAPNAPDLLYNSFAFDLEAYVRNGYLEEISNILDAQLLEDIYPVIRPYCSVDHKLYAIPESVTLQTVCCTQFNSDIGKGWTVDEFFDWMENNGEIESCYSKSDILYQIFLGNLDEYIDFEGKEAYFEGASFQNMVKRFQHLNCEIIPLEGGKFPSGTRAYLMGVSSAVDIAEQEYISNGGVTFVGYPNANREYRSTIAYMPNLSLLTSCDCKEGAADFIHYIYKIKKNMLLYNIEENILPEGRVQPLRSLSEIEFSKCLGEHQMANTIQTNGNMDEIFISCTEEHVEIYEQYLKYVVPYTNERNRIIVIILEELEPYFENQKTIEEVCKIIQSRIVPMLNE